MVKLRFPLRFCLCPSHVVAQKALEGGLQNRLAAILETAEGQSRQSVLRDLSSKSETKSQKKNKDAKERITCTCPCPGCTCKSPCSSSSTCTSSCTCGSSARCASQVRSIAERPRMNARDTHCEEFVKCLAN